MVSTFTYAAIAAAAVASTTQAHQTVYIPAPTFTTTDKTTKTNPIAFLENQGYKPNDDLAGYLKGKGYKTLREFMDNKSNYKTDAAGATFECGYTDPNGARQPIPSNGMMRSSGFTHDGPCEVWIDETRVMGSPTGNCHTDFPGQPVSYKIDFSVCKGDCLIRWYWLGKRLIGSKWSWQVYKECIPISAGGGGGAKRSTNAGAKQRSYDDDDKDSYSFRFLDNSTEPATPEEPTESYRMYNDDDAAADYASFPVENYKEDTESYRMYDTDDTETTSTDDN